MGKLSMFTHCPTKTGSNFGSPGERGVLGIASPINGCSSLSLCLAAVGHQQLYWSHPRKFGQGSRSCRVCANRHGLIRKYGLNMCRQCFRQYAKGIGFVKLD
ncbi:40S ribosomal protein S29-like [Carcharodon carcharias]|uniref:40S ribosomal protein S29-like n=1 Tax=Carcharodon carcharias TaxID=13397 RepID=UPI001B7D9AA3|nr:40S ribosomal protein S29-like [Carcharodon carcharias]